MSHLPSDMEGLEVSSAAEAAHKELIPEHPVSAMVNPLLERSGSSVVKLPSE